MSERNLLAREFVLVYRYFAQLLGDAGALLHHAVQAARRRYREVLS